MVGDHLPERAVAVGTGRVIDRHGARCLGLALGVAADGARLAWLFGLEAERCAGALARDRRRVKPGGGCGPTSGHGRSIYARRAPGGRGEDGTGQRICPAPA